MKERKIIRIERKGVAYSIGDSWLDGYLIESIELRQQGLTAINNITNAGAQPTYLITMVNPVSDKDKKYTLIPADFDAVSFVEEDIVEKDNHPIMREV